MVHSILKRLSETPLSDYEEDELESMNDYVHGGFSQTELLDLARLLMRAAGDCDSLELREIAYNNVFDALVAANPTEAVELVGLELQLNERLSDKGIKLAPELVDILGATRNPKYLDTARELLEHKDPYVRENAQYAVAEIVGDKTS